MSLEVSTAMGMKTGHKNEKREKRKSDRENLIKELEQWWEQKGGVRFRGFKGYGKK